MNVYAGWPALVLRHHRTWFEDRLDTGTDPIMDLNESEVRLALAAVNAELARQMRQAT